MNVEINSLRDFIIRGFAAGRLFSVNSGWLIIFTTDSPGEILSKRGLLRRISLGTHGLAQTLIHADV